MKYTLAFSLALACATMSQAAVTADEAARLGKDLTPWGAEVAGNKDGTIPPYKGGLPVDALGAGFDSNKSLVNGRQVQPDPFKNEKPLYRITAANVSQYADKLSEATKQLFKNDPKFFVDVYPTHRVANYPKYYLESSTANATRCRVDVATEVISGCKGGMPFPIPKNGLEAILNLQLGVYNGPGVDFEGAGFYVDRNGKLVISQDQAVNYEFPFQDPRYSLADYENANNGYGRVIFRTLMDRLGPARLAGEGSVTIRPNDRTPVRSWNYQPGNRRVRTAPNVTYDYPVGPLGGAMFYDESMGLSGAKDRFDWKLIGKQEMIIPYSSYKLAWAKAEELAAPGHPKSEYVRWELHRTWVVEATRKAGASHAYSKRRFYFDEDLPASFVSDAWDDKGNIMRGNFGTALWVPDYQVNAPYHWLTDVISGVFATPNHPGEGLARGMGFRNATSGVGGWNGGPMLQESEWTPEALGRKSQR
jgi:hypothetical protein